jgi:hypothetical protein
VSWGPLIIPVSGRVAAAALLLAAALAVALTVVTLRRPDRRRLALRLGATHLGLLALLLILLEPQILRRVEPATAVLLTPGADAEAVSEAAAGGLLFALEGVSGGVGAFQSIPDAAFLHRHHPEVSRLRVVGHGLDEDDWETLGPMQVELDPPALTRGIERISWRRQLELGQELVVQGTGAGVSEPGRLVLRDPGGGSDSVAVQPAPEAPFELRSVPRAAGRFLYRLELTDAQGRPIVEEDLDVEVVEPARLAVLWLEGAPRFETRFFKDWLAGHGGSVAIRSTVSRDRYRFEFINRPDAGAAHAPPLHLSTIDAALLEEFDLVVVDGRTLASLGPGEREELRLAVARGGAGLLILADDSVPCAAAPSPDLAFFLDFPCAAVGDLEQRRVSLSWPGLGRSPTSLVPVEPEELRTSGAIEALVTDAQGRVLAASRHRGRGTVALSLVREAYRWVLEGSPQFHAAYWSFLTSELARPQRHGERWFVPDGPVLVDRPLPLLLASSEESPLGRVEAEGGPPDRIALRQDPLERGRYEGRFWPRQPGWHRVGSGTGGAWFYAQEPSRFRTWQEARRQDASRRAAALGAQAGREPARRPEPVPPLFFYAVFLACTAYLWAEEKMG